MGKEGETAEVHVSRGGFDPAGGSKPVVSVKHTAVPSGQWVSSFLPDSFLMSHTESAGHPRARCDPTVGHVTRVTSAPTVT